MAAFDRWAEYVRRFHQAVGSEPDPDRIFQCLAMAVTACRHLGAALQAQGDPAGGRLVTDCAAFGNQATTERTLDQARNILRAGQAAASRVKESALAAALGQVASSLGGWGSRMREMVFRAMKEEAGRPKVEPTARGLGVRPPPGTRDQKPDINFVPGTHLVGPTPAGTTQRGLSVAPGNLFHLPHHRRTAAYDPDRAARDLVRAPGGTGKDGVWAIHPARLNQQLQYARDNDHHGSVMPARRMTVEEYQKALAATQRLWKKVPPP